ncbi:MAG TPA: response regulator [Syntrophobacteria bacterium]|nr:response regulator [Syntrophobacteria bacterium]
MEQHNSCINTKAVLDYVEERDPSLILPLLEDLDPELQGIGDLKSFLRDPNNWVSTGVLIRLYDRVKTLFKNDNVVFEIGYDSVAKQRLGYIQRVFLFAARKYTHGMYGQALTLKRIQNLNDKFNRTKRVHLVDLRKEGAVVRLEWFRDIPMTSDFCLMNRGVYTAVPVVWGDPPCELQEHKCFFRGDDCCEYHLGWRRPPSVKNLVLRMIAPWKLASATSEELERDKELLKDKYAEVHGLNLQLKAQVDRLISLQEIGTAILSTLDIHEVVDLILKRLVEVSALDRAAIFLVDAGKQALTMAHAVGIDPKEVEEAKSYVVPLLREKNIIARVARTGEVELVSDLLGSAINLENPLIKRFQPTAFIALPLKVHGKVVGVLVGDAREGGQDLASESDFLLSFSNQIAIAIHNANLYRKLEESERQYRELVENAHEGIWVIDENGLITFANQRLAAIMGQDTLLGHNISELVAPDKKKVLIRLLLQNMQGAVAQEELQLARMDGERLSTIVSSVPIMDGERYKGSFAMVTDITDKKRMEAQLLHRQKMESIGTMAGGIAHDFNNILTGILGYASLLKYRIGEQGDLQRFVQIIETSSLRAADLIRQLLAFSRGTQPEGYQLVSPNRIIRETSKLLESSLGKHVELDLDLSSSLPFIEANATQIQQAILNLCLNARDAMPGGGRMVISTGAVEVGHEGAHLYRNLGAEPGQYVRISVKDTGVGIPKENIDKIFDPFFTTKEVGKGSGLGLAMVYGIVKNSNGYIHVESQEGKGSVFDLLFPVVSGDQNQQPMDQLALGLGGRETVLLVDDEEMVRDLGNEILYKYGYHVISAADGEEALAIWGDKRREIALVILDLVMPNLGGPATLARMREVDPAVKVLICSGYRSKDDELKALQIADVPLILKPFRPEELVTQVRKVLDGRPAFTHH